MQVYLAVVPGEQQEASKYGRSFAHVAYRIGPGSTLLRQNLLLQSQQQLLHLLRLNLLLPRCLLLQSLRRLQRHLLLCLQLQNQLPLLHLLRHQLL